MLPHRRAFALQRGGHHAGWRDKQGEHFRAGADVFVWAYFEWGNLSGRCPARLLRNFQEWGDHHGEYNQRVDLAWCMNAESLALFPEAKDIIPSDVLDLLNSNPNAAVESNWAVEDSFECIITDARVHAVRMNEVGTFDASELADATTDHDIFFHVGTVEINPRCQRHQAVP